MESNCSLCLGNKIILFLQLFLVLIDTHSILESLETFITTILINVCIRSIDHCQELGVALLQILVRCHLKIIELIHALGR